MLAGAALLVGCATPSAPPPAGAPPATAAAAAHAGFEQRYRERAMTAARQGRLADAALAWEVLTVLRPDRRDYRDALAQTRRDIDAALAERLPRAAQAQRRGELDTATQLYLGVLALQPDSAAAADALRAIERERVSRQQLGKPSRLTLTRRAMAEAETQPINAPASGRDPAE